LKSELGDLLFQIVFYARLAEEQQRFNFHDICQAVSDKLVARHPHIFSNEAQITEQRWEQRKSAERHAKAQYSLLDDIPLALPALMRAEKIQKRCASVGFDWQQVEPVIAKVYEELQEVEQELSLPATNQVRIDEELCDLLFATVNLCRHLNVKAERALHYANQKFVRRFTQLEQHLTENEQTLAEATLSEMEQVWRHIKQTEHE